MEPLEHGAVTAAAAEHQSWVVKSRGDVSNLVAGDGIVIAIGDTRGRCFDGHTGARLWSTSGIEDDGGGTAQIMNDTIAYWAEDSRNHGLLLDRTSGKVMGRVGRPIPDVPDRPNRLQLGGWTVITDLDDVNVTSPDGRRWVRAVADPFYDESPPVADGDWLYWGLSDGALFGLKTTDAVEPTVKKLGLRSRSG